MNKFLLLQILFVTVLSINVWAQKKADPRALITIERSECFGSCPIYSAQIYTDGTVIYHGEDFVKVKGERKHKISSEKLKRLIKAFEDADYFSLKDDYRYDENGMSITDQPTTTTSISLDGRRKSVVNYYSAPRKLKALENMIEKIAELDRYIGPV